MNEIISDAYLATLNPPDLSKLPQPVRGEMVTIPARALAELVGFAQQYFETPDEMDEFQAGLMEGVCLCLGRQAPTTWRWWRAREDALDAWLKTLHEDEEA